MVGREIVWPTAAMLPVGPLSIAACLLERGHEVDFQDFVFASSLPDEIDASRFDIVLLACHTLRNLPTARAVLRCMRGARYVVLGGNLCSELTCSDFRAAGLTIDAVVRGYGHGLVKAIEELQIGDLEPAIVPSRMPKAGLQLLDEHSRQQYLKRSGGRYPMIGPGGFGCAWSCNYCTAKMLSGRITRQFADMETEIHSAQRYGYQEIWCVDNIALADAAAALDFDSLVAGQSMRWLCMTRAETIKSEHSNLTRMRCLTDVALGVEATKRNLKALNRGERGDNDMILKKAFRILHDCGVSSTAFVMLDLPGSCDEDHWGLINLLAEVAPGNVSWSFYNPPALEILSRKIDPARTGFYRWPLGFAQIPDVRVVQFAMTITGTWWMNWAPKTFFQGPDEFGVVFDEGEISQQRSARSILGDLWSIWKYKATTPNCSPSVLTGAGGIPVRLSG